VNQQATKSKQVNNLLKKSFLNGFIIIKRHISWSSDRVLVRSKKGKIKGKTAAGEREFSKQGLRLIRIRKDSWQHAVTRDTLQYLAPGYARKERMRAANGNMPRDISVRHFPRLLLGSCDWYKNIKNAALMISIVAKTAGKQNVLLYDEPWNIFASLIVSGSIGAQLTLHNAQWYRHHYL